MAATGTAQNHVVSAQGVRVWLRRLPGTRYLPWRYVVTGTVQAADEVPQHLGPRTAIVVINNGKPSWVAFDCPRHRHERLLVNLASHPRPHWTLAPGPRLTLTPSVDAVHNGQHCHFWIRNGKVEWHD